MASDGLKRVSGGLSRRRFLQGLGVSTVAAAELTSCAQQADTGEELRSATGARRAGG